MSEPITKIEALVSELEEVIGRAEISASDIISAISFLLVSTHPAQSLGMRKVLDIISDAWAYDQQNRSSSSENQPN